MTGILCATDAGQGSRQVHVAAFERAAASTESLTFLHVVGGPDYTAQSEQMRAAILHESKWLLHAMLRVARERAGTPQVEPEVLVREGDAASEILAQLREYRHTLLLVGRPRSTVSSHFDEATFARFLLDVERLTVPVETAGG